MLWEPTTVTLVATQLLGDAPIERRRYPRVELNLSGRYMAHDRQEYPCRTLNISPGGIAILSMAKGFIGERVVAYFDHIGRIEGMIVRNFDKCFAVTLQLPAPKREKIARSIAWLVERHTRGGSDNRVHERLRPYRQLTTLTMDGRQYEARLIDVSIFGAALRVDATPPIGSPVVIGRTPAHVARHLAEGIAVEFDEQLRAETFNLDVKL
jgi:PilZ domain